jgi:hypothetical protein
LAILGVLLPLAWSVAKSYRGQRYRVVLSMQDGSEVCMPLTSRPSPAAISILNAARVVTKVDNEVRDSAAKLGGTAKGNLEPISLVEGAAEHVERADDVEPADVLAHTIGKPSSSDATGKGAPRQLAARSR